MDSNAIPREMAIQEMARRELARRQQAAPIPAEPQQPSAYRDRGSFAAASEAASDVFGLGDEMTAGVFAAGESLVDAARGKGFNYSDNYSRILGELDAMTKAREEAHPVASLVGNVAGDVAAGGTLAKGGLTMAGKGVVPAAIEGGLYGGTAGSGYARQGEKVGGAAAGATIGAVTGGALEKVGGMLANRSANKAAQQFRNANPAQSADQLADDAGRMFEQMRASGARLPKSAGVKARANIDVLLRQSDPELAPNAFALKKVVDQRLGKGDLDIVEWHNLSKIVNRVSRGNLSPEDAHAVGIVKKQIDALRDGQIIGNSQVRNMWKKANELVVRQKKVEILDEALNMADMDTGQYTQAELAHTIAKRFRQVYANKRLRSQFSPEEQAVIKQIGQAKTHSALINGLKKLAPRGIVSAALGAGVLGSLFPGGQIIVPALGEAAQRLANRSATGAAQQFIGDVSRGSGPALHQLPNRLAPFLPGASSSTGGQQRLLRNALSN